MLENLLSGGLTVLGIAQLLVEEGLVSGVPGGHPSFGIHTNDPADICRPASAHLLDYATCDQVASANS
jgi:hypothetical protein